VFWALLEICRDMRCLVEPGGGEPSGSKLQKNQRARPRADSALDQLCVPKILASATRKALSTNGCTRPQSGNLGDGRFVPGAVAPCRPIHREGAVASAAIATARSLQGMYSVMARPTMSASAATALRIAATSSKPTSFAPCPPSSRPSRIAPGRSRGSSSRGHRGPRSRQPGRDGLGRVYAEAVARVASAIGQPRRLLSLRHDGGTFPMSESLPTGCATAATRRS
jgi:hypothetical protein